jgi:hypothetical protein
MVTILWIIGLGAAVLLGIESGKIHPVECRCPECLKGW